MTTDAARMQAICFSIVSHGHGPFLQRLLSQMNGQPALRGAFVVVTLNLPGEAFDPAPFANLNIHVIRNGMPKGFGTNHNVAFYSCKAPWFGILNPDLALVDQEPFSDMLRRQSDRDRFVDDRTALIAPRVLGTHQLPEDSVRANLTPWSLAWRALGNRSPLQVREPARAGAPFYWVAGMCLLTRSTAFREIGGFDERFFLYCEDYDLCARFYNAGYAVRLDEQAAIIHEAQRDSRRNWRHLRWHLASLFKVWTSTAFWRLTFSAKST